jgi:hypothetical protein
MKSEPHSPFTITRNVLLGLLAICCVMVVIGVFIPMSEPRIPLNHMRTAHWVLTLIAAERQYAERFQAAGFTCDFHQLEQTGIVDKVFASGVRSGYRYELQGCDATTPVSRFSVSAVPTTKGKTGDFAFCTNQEGLLWYSKDGSADECFKARTRWTNSDPLAE